MGMNLSFADGNFSTSAGALQSVKLVGVANVVDVQVVGGGSALRGVVICFYLSNEGLSLLENAAHIGLPVPERLKAVLAQLHGREDEGGAVAQDGEGGIDDVGEDR